MPNPLPPLPAGPRRPAPQTNEVILMTATQSTQRHGATWWRAACRAAAALRAIHDEQVLMWELVWRSSRVPVDRAGPLAWTPSLDGPRLTGRHLPSPDEPQAARRP
jgi:hypothetical protein